MTNHFIINLTLIMPLIGLSYPYYTYFIITRCNPYQTVQISKKKDSSLLSEFFWPTFISFLIVFVAVLSLKTRVWYVSSYFTIPVYMRVYIITFIITALIIFNINIIKIQSYLIHFTLLIPFIVYALLITHNLILLILIIELVGTIYLFFFLNTDSITTYSTIKLKNLISNYIWFSFITLIFFLFSILLLLKNIVLIGCMFLSE